MLLLLCELLAIVLFLNLPICSFNFPSSTNASLMIFSFPICVSFPWFSFRAYVCCLRGGGCGADALVVQKSGSSSVLTEGKPESCGKTLLLVWLV